MLWTETPSFDTAGGTGKERFSLCYHYIDPVGKFIYGTVRFTWTPTESDLKELGITADMNWYELRHLLDKKAETMALANPDPDSVRTVLYPTGYRPGGLSSPNYKKGKSGTIERGKAKIERMAAKARQK